ncbi:hypothetical protein [Mangrovimonas aestuarii]|uniref:hypothetical protein n=1 Tax=Mangrovimonas aestuarii TaxID=3018443 RepID=UPI002379AF71|nr:hypothetical protein [Mangrovimonas aestuarii]
MKSKSTKDTKLPTLFYLSAQKRKSISLFLAIITLNFSLSCSYYTVRDVTTSKEQIPEQIKKLNEQDQYVIIHTEEQLWHLDNMVISDNSQLISGTVKSLDSDHIYKRQRDKKRVHRYNRQKTEPLNEVHLYLQSPPTFKMDNHIEIPVEKINRVSVNDKNSGRSVANVALTAVGVIAIAFIIIEASDPVDGNLSGF